MRRIVLAIALPAALIAAPAAAQDEDVYDDYDTPDYAIEDEVVNLDRLADALSDPVRQQQLATILGAMSNLLLDLPLAPIIEPLAEAAGEDPRDIDPDMTLRRMSPESGDAVRRIEGEVPRAMDRMAAISGAFAALMPALKDMAERMEDALPTDDFRDRR